MPVLEAAEPGEAVKTDIELKRIKMFGIVTKPFSVSTLLDKNVPSIRGNENPNTRSTISSAWL